MPYVARGGASVEDEYIHVACPCCKNKRLFDLLRGSKGIVSIKCPIYKAVVAVSLHDGRASSNKIIEENRTEQIGA